MRFVDRYGFRARLIWFFGGWLLIVKDARNTRRHTRVYGRRRDAETALLSYGSHWHRVGLFGRVDEKTLGR